MTATSRVRMLLPLLVATVHVAFLAWQAPHTVHHFFERELEKQNECAFSTAAERSSGTPVASISIAPVAAVESLMTIGTPAFVPRPTPSVLRPRAPPPSAA
jgi:hypothetical protein